MQAVSVKKSEVPKPWLQAYPKYTGRKFKMVLATSVDMSQGYWSGGSKDYFMGIDLKTNQIYFPSNKIESPEVFGGFNPQQVPIPEHAVIAKHTIFCGKDLGITFYINPNSFAVKFLPNSEIKNS